MKRVSLCIIGMAMAAGAVGWLGRGDIAAADDKEPMIVHNVFFSMAESGGKVRGEFVSACEKFLGDHPGVVYFAAGPRAMEFERDVNDQDFDVGLHIVFKDKAAHDKYQASDKHKQFVSEWAPRFKKVRVFDSKVMNSKSTK